jgi:hypothetical protein
MAPKIRLDRGGMAAMLKSAGVASAVEAAAESTFSNVGAVEAHDGQVVPVEVTTGTTDRAIARVTLLHAAGLGLQAKHGTLTKAAQAAGLQVRAAK